MAEGTTWVLGRKGGEKVIGELVADFVTLSAQLKPLETRLGLVNAALRDYCDRRWSMAIGAQGLSLPSPIKLVNEAGQTITFVVQDRSRSAELKADAYAELVTAIGSKQAKVATAEKVRVGFDPDVLDELALDGRYVQDAVEEHAKLMVGDMVLQKVLTRAQAEKLLVVARTRRLREGFLSSIPHWCDLDVERFRAAICAVGAAFTRFIRI